MAQRFGFCLQITQAANDTFYRRLGGRIHIHFHPVGIFQTNVVAGLEVAPRIKEGRFVSDFIQVPCSAGNYLGFFTGSVTDDAQETENDFVVRRRADVG